MKKILTTDFECLENAAIQPMAASGSGEAKPKERVRRKRWVKVGTKQKRSSTCVMYAAAQIYNSIPDGKRRAAHRGMPEVDSEGNAIKDENDIIKMGPIPNPSDGLSEYQAYFMYEEFLQREKGYNPDAAANKRNQMLSNDNNVNGVTAKETQEFISWLTKGTVNGEVEKEIGAGDHEDGSNNRRSYLSYTWNQIPSTDSSGQTKYDAHCFLVYGYTQDAATGKTTSYQGYDPMTERDVVLPPGQNNKLSDDILRGYGNPEGWLDYDPEGSGNESGGGNESSPYNSSTDPWNDFWDNFDEENWVDPWAYNSCYYSGGYNSVYYTFYYGGYPEGYWLYYYVYV